MTIRFIFLLCFFLITALPAKADSEGVIGPYTIETADKKYLFVMSYSANGYTSEAMKPYPQSGLYRNDGSTTPLWTVGWYGQVFLPADFETEAVEKNNAFLLLRDDAGFKKIIGGFKKQP